MGRRILVVDDEPDVLRTVGFRLQKLGYVVETAVDGQAALNQVAAHPPDLLLLDLRLPVVDGYAVCRQIKAHSKWKDIPVILFTASANISAQELIQSLGAQDCVTKPFDWEQLAQKIEHFLPA